MKASRFPREYRVYNLETGKMMYAKELNDIGFSLTADGLPSYREQPFPAVVMWKTTQKDAMGKWLWEGDIVKCDIQNEFGSYNKEYAIMRWEETMLMFVLKFQKEPALQPVNMRVELLGNEFTNPEFNNLVS